MQKFKLELFLQIIGIGSASGLFFKDNTIYVISDNGGYLYQYGIADKTLEIIRIFENETLENIPKKIKPDFEALAYYDSKFYAFGSGSTENRNKMVTIDKAKKEIAATDLTLLYASMQSFAKISPDDFNIEGATYDGEQWYFFQRGNGAKGKNGVFTVTGNNLEYDFSILYNDVKLPKINGIRATFTDAAFVSGKIYFLATAEDSKSTYKDGDILGSLVGTIDPKTMKVTYKQKITDELKFEGITFYQENADSITFLLCEDNDSDVLNAAIYKLVLAK